MRPDSLGTKILYFIYAMQIVPQKSIRFMDKDYDHAGRVLKLIKDKGYIYEDSIDGETVVELTPCGFNELEKLHYQICHIQQNREPKCSEASYGECCEANILKSEKIEPNILSNEFQKQMKLHVRDEKRKKRQIRLSYSIAMLFRYFPDCITNYLNTEYQYMLNEIQKDDNVKQELSEEIRKRNVNNQWILMTREIRYHDKSNLKLMSSLRAQGLLHFKTGTYAVYNHMSQCMRAYNIFEQKFYYFSQSLLRMMNHTEEPINSIIFAKSYRVAVSTIEAPEHVRPNYLLSNGVYSNQYYVPLTGAGAKQIEILNILNFRETVKNGILHKADIDRAINQIYDGEDENGNAIFLGFECNLNEIQKIYNALFVVYLSKNVTIYCFEWQKEFYKRVFKDRCTLKVVDFDKLVEYAKEYE